MVNAPPKKRPTAVDRSSPVPLFFQVAEDLRKRLRAGRYKVGQRFTTVRKVALDYEVSFVTAQKAMAHLSDEGLTRSERGRGTVIARRSSPPRGASARADQPAPTQRVVLIWPTQLPVAPALQSNLLSTFDGIRAALPDRTLALEFAGDLLLEEGAKATLDSLAHASGFCGFCLVSAPPYVKRYFARTRLPTVVLGDVEPGICLSFVSSREEKAQYDLTRHLIELGHQRIAQIFGAPRVAGHDARLRGYRQALLEAGFYQPPRQTDLELTVPYDRPTALARFSALFRGAEAPTAAICTGRVLASWVRTAAGDAVHLGYDDDGGLQETPLERSTILIWPGEEIGRRAGKMLDDQIRGDGTTQSEVYDYVRIQDHGL